MEQNPPLKHLKTSLDNFRALFQLLQNGTSQIKNAEILIQYHSHILHIHPAQFNKTLD
jgi:hypothetical protein